MQITVRPFLLLLALATLLAASGSLLAHWLKGSNRLTRLEIILCALPSLTLLGLFYSLALHMHLSLGAWPSSIGERGFPPGLLAHGNAAVSYYGILLLATLFVWPAVFLVCWLVRSWRRWTLYLGIHVLSLIVCIFLTRLAPSPFLYWWDD